MVVGFLRICIFVGLDSKVVAELYIQAPLSNPYILVSHSHSFPSFPPSPFSNIPNTNHPNQTKPKKH